MIEKYTLNRRDFLRVLGVAAFVFAGSGFINGCASLPEGTGIEDDVYQFADALSREVFQGAIRENNVFHDPALEIGSWLKFPQSGEGKFITVFPRGCIVADFDGRGWRRFFSYAREDGLSGVSLMQDGKGITYMMQDDKLTRSLFNVEGKEVSPIAGSGREVNEESIERYERLGKRIMETYR